MTQAQGARHSISYVSESVFGTTPDTPSMLLLRNTGTTLITRKETFQSEEIRDDRQVVDLRHGARRADGDINFEFSYGAFDDWLEAALFGSWSGDELKVGVTPKSFTVERGFADVSQYLPFTGVMINTLALNISPNAMVTGTFGVIGTGVMEPSGTSLGTPSPVASHPPFDGFSGQITEGGSVATVTALTLNLNNNLNPSYVIGADTAPQILAGQAVLTGNLTAWFESEAMLNKFLHEAESALSLTLEGASGGDIRIEIPRLKYTAAEIDVTNATDGVVVSMPWQGLRDDAEATNLKLTRVPA